MAIFDASSLKRIRTESFSFSTASQYDVLLVHYKISLAVSIFLQFSFTSHLLFNYICLMHISFPNATEFSFLRDDSRYAFAIVGRSVLEAHVTRNIFTSQLYVFSQLASVQKSPFIGEW